MKHCISLVICTLLLLAPLRAQSSYRIAFLSSEPVGIDGTPKRTGDVFTGDARIEWSDDSQVMKVVETPGKRQYVLAAKALPGKKSGILGEYLKINRQLSTRNAAFKEAQENGSRFYLGYEQDGRQKTLIPTYGMFMDTLPREIWLCLYEPGTGKSRVLTKDFRAFVDELIITEALVQRLMDRMGYDDDAFLQLMNAYTDERFRHIDYTLDNLKIFVSLKY